MTITFPKVAQLKTPEALRNRLAELKRPLPVDESILTAEQGSPLAQPLQLGEWQAGNRWCIHPMEGWDANEDGSPSELTLRRWENFGRSGAKLIWGGEAAAVVPEGRANPRQTLATESNRTGLTRLLQTVRDAHQREFGASDDLIVGLQLTHSGRFARPTAARPAPRIAYHHPLLDPRVGIDPNDDSVVLSDAEVESLIPRYVHAAEIARDVGFQFVDVKACHGYLLHEFLSARTRRGPYGGDYAGRTRILTTIIERIRESMPGLGVGVRLSIYDSLPYQPAEPHGVPVPFDHLLPYRFGFGLNADDPLAVDLAEPIRLLRDLQRLGVLAVNITCGSPYYNPHIQRPAIFPPSDGYQPPEDPLVGVARLIEAARNCKREVPELPLIGTGYTYLQDYLPHVAQAVVRENWIDSVGLGRMVLSYPRLPADCLQRGMLARKRVCRTFSDCTTGPRMGLISGCFPLDPFYKTRAEAGRLKDAKRAD